jgi:hypothetical protein
MCHCVAGLAAYCTTVRTVIRAVLPTTGTCRTAFLEITWMWVMLGVFTLTTLEYAVLVPSPRPRKLVSTAASSRARSCMCMYCEGCCVASSCVASCALLDTPRDTVSNTFINSSSLFECQWEIVQFPRLCLICAESDAFTCQVNRVTFTGLPALYELSTQTLA